MVAPLARRREISWTIIWRLTFNSLAKVPPEMGLLLEDRIFRSCFRLSSPSFFISCLLVCDESYLLPCRAFVKHVLGRVDGGKQVTSILIITVGGGVQPNRAYSTG